ncbi:unnamed protein product [Chrysodeixis includens]|uniref:Major facilitator superfamily (MFS) profile domain-containing protein n=1 Tax=Chrysodeixis includens TaxID=689277 RepID=A0A9P0FRU2_CHRIL|nr:unnamed protein product [Chrysodeixis includens]
MTSNPGAKLNSRRESSNKNVYSLSSNGYDDKVYTYGEAINLAGNGRYSFGLLATLSVCTLAMGVDMFGFSVVVNGCTCDFNLNISQTSVLLSMPFVGPIVMAYPWGYISDTRGRRRSLLIAMWISFAVSTASAFSPNWVVMAVLKFVSTSFCSCAQSASYTLLGESCSEKARDSYMLIMTSVLDFSLAAYVAVAYFILNMDFSYDMGALTFTPWRLLALALALPLGIGAFGTHFFYESPKFLVNVQRHDEALECLRKIWRRNNGKGDKYPVKRIILNEEGNERRKDASLVQSLWEQIVPLFKPPLLWRSIMLYFFTAVIFSTNNSFFIWFPYLAEKFTAGMNSSAASHETGLCNMIVSNNNDTSEAIECTSTMQISLVWSSLAQGVSFVLIMLVITKLAYRKKALMIIIMTFSGLASMGAALIRDNLTSFIMFFGLLTNELCIGIIYTYFVDLYPTSYRGMAACIGVMVARASALSGVNLLGAYIMTHCSAMFYTCGGLMLVAAAVSFLLPPDVRKK